MGEGGRRGWLTFVLVRAVLRLKLFSMRLRLVLRRPKTKARRSKTKLRHAKMNLRRVQDEKKRIKMSTYDSYVLFQKLRTGGGLIARCAQLFFSQTDHALRSW